ncbi:MAG: hypothetical protein ACI9MC_000725 [Kiritimatiellia bacterium]|jgi:hypothetical protein
MGASRLSLFMLAALVATQHAFACETASTSKDVAGVVEQAMLTFQNADLDGFLRQSNTVEEQVACLRDQPSAAVMAAVHRTLGLRAFIERRNERAASAFRAARSLDGSFSWSNDVLPEGHPARTLYDEAVDGGGGETVPEPAEGELRFDGQVTLERPTQRATIFQRSVKDHYADAAYVWPGQPLPTYPLPSAGGGKLRVVLGAGAAGALLTSGVLYGIAASNASKYRDAEVDYPNGPKLRRSANNMVVASGIAGITAVGLGTGFALAGRF